MALKIVITQDHVGWLFGIARRICNWSTDLEPLQMFMTCVDLL